MSFADDLELERQPRRLPCPTCEWLKAQKPAVQAAFANHVADGGKYSQLLRACQKHGLTVERTSFVKHFQDGHDVR